MGVSQQQRLPAARSPALWAVQGLLVGGLALLGALAFQREARVVRLAEELGEVRGALAALRGREDRVERQVYRVRRDVALGRVPEIHEQSYFSGGRRHVVTGGSGQGGEGDQGHQGEQFPPPPPAGGFQPESRPAGRAPSSFKKPEVKSLGTPDQPTGPSTAVQLEAGEPASLRHDGQHTHWKLARWARRLGAADSFPLSSAGELGVPSPGLYLVYAQVSYLDKARQRGFTVQVNDRPKLVCEERRGAGMQMGCYTGGLLYLEQGDKVSIKDADHDSQVDAALGKSFFGVVKLTGDWI